MSPISRFNCVHNSLFVLTAISLLSGCGTSQLPIAVASKNIDQVRQLLDKGEKPSYQALIIAVQERSVPITQLLLDRGADVNADGGQGLPPLMQAAYDGDFQIVTILLEKGAKVDSVNKRGMTPLLWACDKGYVDVARILLERGADVHHRTDTGITPLIAAGTGKKLEIAQMLLDRGARVNDLAKDGDTPLTQAAFGGNSEIVRLLVDKGADIHHRTPQGFTAFGLACYGGNAPAAVYLFEKGADPAVPDKWVEMNGKIHHILGDYYLALDNYPKAKESYQKAKDNYAKTVDAYKAKVAGEELKEFGLFMLGAMAGAAADTMQAYQGQMQSRQMAQISAMKYADRTHTGIQGYSAYMSRYNQTYVPTYSTVNLQPLPTPSENAPVSVKKLYAQDKVELYHDLQSLMTRILDCFQRGMTGAELHSAIAQASSAKKPASTN